MAGCEEGYIGHTDIALAPLPGNGNDLSSSRFGRQQSAIRQRRFDCAFSELTMNKGFVA